MSKEVLFKLTRDVLCDGTESQKYHLWRWVLGGHDVHMVSDEFKNAWNACDIFDWIEHKEYFEPLFKDVKNNQIDYNPICEELKKLKILNTNEDVHNIIDEAIHKIINVSFGKV